jgi:putative Mg2+ transporter-C (MgtC) family protein
VELSLVQDLKFLVPLAVAALLGGALGLERELKGKAAGLRTLILVSMSSAFFVLLGEVAPKVTEQVTSDVRVDPVRIIQAVAIGIGFIGSGVVKAASEEKQADGLTTAATVWATAAVGIAAGFGRYVLATAAVAFTLLVTLVLGRIEKRIEEHRGGRKAGA